MLISAPRRLTIAGLLAGLALVGRLEAQATDTLAAYRSSLVHAMSLGQGESYRMIAARLKGVTAPTEFKMLQSRVLNEAKAAGRLEERAADQNLPSDCAAPAGGSGTTTCRMPVSQLNTRALEAGRLLPDAISRYTRARDSLLVALDRRLAPAPPP